MGKVLRVEVKYKSPLKIEEPLLEYELGNGYGDGYDFGYGDGYGYGYGSGDGNGYGYGFGYGPGYGYGDGDGYGDGYGYGEEPKPFKVLDNLEALVQLSKRICNLKK